MKAGAEAKAKTEAGGGCELAFEADVRLGRYTMELDKEEEVEEEVEEEAVGVEDADSAGSNTGSLGFTALADMTTGDIDTTDAAVADVDADAAVAAVGALD